MNLQALTPTQIAIIVAVIVVVIGAIVFAILQKRRTEKLRQHFGPEYDRAVAEGGDRRLAESRLEERTERVKKFHIRPLTVEDRARFTEQWDRVQAQVCGCSGRRGSRSRSVDRRPDGNLRLPDGRL